jgi:hypothetical protein
MNGSIRVYWSINFFGTYRTFDSERYLIIGGKNEYSSQCFAFDFYYYWMEAFTRLMQR